MTPIALMYLILTWFSASRVKEANALISNQLKGRLKYEVHDLENWQPDETSKFDLIVLKMAFHHIERIEYFIQLFNRILTEDGKQNTRYFK
jgi:hypothetical protein